MKHERLQNKLSFEMVQRRKCAPADVAWLWSVTPGSHFVQAEVALSQSTSLQHDGHIGPGGKPHIQNPPRTRSKHNDWKHNE